MRRKPKTTRSAENTDTIRGLIVPAGWDEKGRVTAVALSTHDEEEYFIDPDGKGADLLAFIRRQVDLHGVVRRQNRRRVFVVFSYEIIDGNKKRRR